MTKWGVVRRGYSLVSNSPMVRSSNSHLMNSALSFEQFSAHHFIIWWVWRKEQERTWRKGGRAQEEAISVIFWNHADANEIKAKYGGSTSEGHHFEVQRSALRGSSYLARVRGQWAKRHQRLQKAAKLLYITIGGRVCANDSRGLWKISQQQLWNLWIVSGHSSITNWKKCYDNICELQII